MTRSRRCLAAWGMFAAAAACSPSWAFKINTHLWVGQQIINDLEDDGFLSVKLKRPDGTVNTITLPVRSEVKSAILQNKNVYLLGHLGPDAMPDVLVGQTIMHPGGKGWKANDWANYMLRSAGTNPVGVAYAYGYLGHGAADVFAHTYVNQYAGDAFELTDGETLVEERHVALESYIGKYTPPMVNAAGVNLGTAYQVVYTSAPLASYLRDTLIYAGEPLAQYRQEVTAPHLLAFQAYRAALDTAAETDIWRRLDTAIVQYVAAQYGIALSSSQAGQALDGVASVNSKINQGINVTQQELTNLNNSISALDLRFAQNVNGALNRVVSLENQLLSAQAELEARLLEKACEQVSEVCRVPVPGVCWSWLGPYPCTQWVNDPVCVAAFNATCRALSTLNTLRNEALLALSNQRSRISAELLSLHSELSKARASHLALSNALIDLAQIPTQGSSPLQAVLRNWRSDADLIFADYIRAATQTMLNTMGSSSVSVTAPMQTWLDCSGPALMGLPLAVSGCTQRAAALQLFNTLDRLSNLPADGLAVSIGLPTSTELQALKARLIADVTNRVKDQVTQGLIKLLPAEVQGIINVLKDDMTDVKLRGYYTKPAPPGKALVMIPDIDIRVNREMNANLTARVFDPTRFAAAADAVTLAKLALLDNEGLVQLAQYAGLAGSAVAGVSNIMADAFVSFDGNHQWLDQAPPRPRSSGSFLPPELRDLSNGQQRYPYLNGYRSVAGFLPWRADLRTVLFRGLFIGPLSPGLENPFELGADLAVVLPAAYPYRPCRKNPFPDGWAASVCPGALEPWVQPPAPPAPPSVPPPPPPPPPECRMKGAARPIQQCP